eukprot:579916-Pyramimonas_sp.AAC.1
MPPRGGRAASMKLPVGSASLDDHSLIWRPGPSGVVSIGVSPIAACKASQLPLRRVRHRAGAGQRLARPRRPGPSPQPPREGRK